MPTFEELIARFAFLASGPALTVIFGTAAILVIVRDRRILILALAVQSVFAGLLFTQVLPPRVAGVKMLTGLLICVIYYVTAQQIRPAENVSSSSNVTTSEESDISPLAALISRLRSTFRLEPRFPFRIIAVVMVGIAAPQAAAQFDLGLLAVSSEDVSAAMFTLIGLGLLLLGLSEDPLKVGMGLLTVLTGFELFYSIVEPALAVIALLAVVNFAVALGASYLAVIRAQAALEGARPSQ